MHGVKIQSAAQQLHSEGIYFLYRGLLPPLLQKSISLSIMFGVYEEVKRPLIEDYNVNAYVAKTAGGLISGSCEAILMPFERVQTLLINAKYHDMYKNTFQAFRSIGLNYGFKEYYRGMVPILLRNGPSNVLFFIVREDLQERYPKMSNRLERTIFDFISGAVIGATLSTIFYPCNVIKVSMQNQIGGRYQNVYECAVQIYRERGCKLSNFYLGASMNVTRAFLSWGVVNTAYEYLKLIIY